ncbi:beta-alanine-activating enzyme-like isoform X2 [Biomphalaria glabrata]|uniref:Beta-alanine-activating enzyme-like isoform X2 n=1 Tax=Biomphalaria glabrata TaxID=6526 RepID=A0A9W3B2K1_BIOGL|nr:beta-alanine-activating enzyme-like isoform X2 [Biomphalaria glabrata]XP_055893697.1 beta-alanine-activating enzyme-like isoform X2 [Biomphalaria glabrata]XP_055893698.1 beta-alanine-activating enzyme-like isoform X2 [Biomphalaria glabrata]KAI8756660.1 acyl-CoA synthetase family member 4-like [Biomphalaria glabrata]
MYHLNLDGATKISKKMKLLHELVFDSASKHPHNYCVIFDDGDDGGFHNQTHGYNFNSETKLSYKQLIELADKFKQVFQCLQMDKQLIAVCLGDCFYLPPVLLGLLSCGCVFHPISLDALNYTRQALVSSGVTWMIIHDRFLKTFNSLIQSFNGRQVISDTLQTFHLLLIQLETSASLSQPSDLAYCITTSGTTGLPKVIKVSHSSIVPNILHLRDILKLSPEDKVLLTSPLTFDPSIVDIFCTLSCGACLVIVPTELKHNPDQFLKTIHHRHKISVLQATPSLMRTLSPSRLQTTLLGSELPLRVLALGGEKFPEFSELMTWISKDNKTTQLYNLYGVTEMSCWATCHLVDITDILTNQDDVPLGTTLDKTVIKLKPHNSINEGEIWLGTSERLCYINNELPLMEAGTMWINTGDWGRMTTTGTIVFSHRMDEQVKRMGKRMNLAAIEMVIRSVPGVVNCSVQLDDQQLLAFIVTDTPIPDHAEKVECLTYGESESKKKGDGHWSEIKLNLMKTLEDALPSHCKPDHFIHVSEGLPITANGKLDKRKLLKLAKKRKCLDGFGLQKNPLESAQDLWLSVLSLKIGHIDPSDTFMSLGGDSLAAVRLINIVESLHGDQLSHMFDVLVNRDFKTFVDHWTKYVHLIRSPQESVTSAGAVRDSGKDNLQDLNLYLEQEKSNGELTKKKLKNSHPSIEDIFQPLKSTVSVRNVISRGGNMHSISKQANVLANVVNNVSSTLGLKSGSVRHLGLEIKWKYNTKKCVDASPLIVEYKDRTLVFIGSHSGLFSALDVDSGQEVWSKQLSDRLESSACIEPEAGLIVVGCYNGLIYVLDARSGHTEWTFETHDMVKCCPVIDTKTRHVLCGSHDGYIYCLHVQQKKCVWKQNCGGSIFSSPVIDNTQCLLFVATLAGQVSALSLETGNVLWSVQLNKPVFSSLCTTGHHVLVGCVNGCVYCLNTHGEMVWSYKTDGPIFSTPVVCDSYIYLGCHDTYIYCLTDSGQLQWRFKTNSTVYATVFIGCRDATITLPSVTNINQEDSHITRPQSPDASHECLDNVCSCQHIQIAVTAGSKGTLYVLCAECGLELGQTDLPGEIFSSPIQCGKQIVLGCRDNYVYCFTLT